MRAGTPAQLDEVMRTGLLQLVVDRLDKVSVRVRLRVGVGVRVCEPCP